MSKSHHRWWQDNTVSWESWAFWFVAVFCLVLFTVLATIGITVGQAISNHVERTNCAKFEKASGYDTGFAYYGFWDNECFVIGPNNVRIPLDKMFNNVGN